MKKSEMRANGVKTAELQYYLRKMHAQCVFDGSELWIGFRRKDGEHMATCSDCLIDKYEDYGFYAPLYEQYRRPKN